MYLYLVRHGEAKREEEDPLRSLSDKGISDVSRIASHLQYLYLPVLRIFHSPKVRAKQTAEILCEYLRPVNGVTEADGLAPLDSPEVWATRIRDMKEDFMIVGHLPHLVRLASVLLCGTSVTDIIAFRTAGIVCLKRDDAGAWSLEWALAPEIVPGDGGKGYSCDSL